MQSNKDTCESLAAVVAEKNNEIMALHHKIQHLIETCHEAGIMVHFKDATIKQMREDQKASEFKVSTLSCSVRAHHLMWLFRYKGSCHHLTN